MYVSFTFLGLIFLVALDWLNLDPTIRFMSCFFYVYNMHLCGLFRMLNNLTCMSVETDEEPKEKRKKNKRG